MKSPTYPLAVPADLLDEVRRTAKETGLSMADAMRRSMRLGLPKLRDQLAPGTPRPFTASEIRAAFKNDAEWEAFEAAMTSTASTPAEKQPTDGGKPHSVRFPEPP